MVRDISNYVNQEQIAPTNKYIFKLRKENKYFYGKLVLVDVYIFLGNK